MRDKGGRGGTRGAGHAAESMAQAPVLTAEDLEAAWAAAETSAFITMLRNATAVEVRASRWVGDKIFALDLSHDPFVLRENDGRVVVLCPPNVADEVRAAVEEMFRG